MEPQYKVPHPKGGAQGFSQLVGTNPNPRVAGLEELPGKVNYFRGNDPQRWRTDIPTYARTKYQDVYPGVDLVYYGDQRQLEYDFVVAPGADPGVIRLAFDGLVGAIHELPLRIADNGDLVLLTGSGEVRFLKPQIYQEINGNKRFIPGQYVLFDPETQDSEFRTYEVGFQVAAYDASKPLIIDPVLSYSTYLGGSGSEFAAGIAVDTSGNAYVTVSTPCFVAKINAAGSALVYSTYLGGADACGDIAVDAAGNAYVVGTTSSPDFPTVNPLQRTLGGGSDAFVAKPNAAGSVVYSTFLGGSSTEFAGGSSASGSSAVDAAGNAYVTGITCSSDFPTFPTMNPIQATNHGGDSSCGFDAFVAKINAEGSALVYSTYLGSSGHEEVGQIAVDAAGNAYVTGRTYASDFPTANPLYPFGGGDEGVNADAFVTKINAAGSALVYSTFLGGSARDYGNGIGVDAAGNAYVTASPVRATSLR
ncbi:MAG: SBBP repeat-containing protein [Deltaproteobacteria bacterium]|nr:SBBP repeat-containing protein [Deltaproteobacteria bacterium]